MPKHADHFNCFHPRVIRSVCALGVLVIFTGGALQAEASVPSTADTVYNGPEPGYGGDRVPGETEDSYLARTGHRLPASSAYGGDPVPGETDESYFGRTGDHLPGRCVTSRAFALPALDSLCSRTVTMIYQKAQWVLHLWD